MNKYRCPARVCISWPFSMSPRGSSIWMSTVLLFLFLAAGLHAGPLEDQTQQLLAKLPQATDKEVRAIIEKLAEIGPEARAALPVLVDYLERGRFYFAVVDALKSMGGEAVQALRDGLSSDKRHVRYWMLRALGDMRRDAEPLLHAILPLTHDKDKEVRRLAAKTLGKLKLQVAMVTVPALVELLALDDRFVAASAADALRDMGPIAAPAIPALEQAACHHKAPYVRCRSLYALVAVDKNGEAAVRVLSLGLRDTGSYGTFQISVDRVAAANVTFVAREASPAGATLFEILESDQIRQNIRHYEQISFTLAALGNVDAAAVFQRDLAYKSERKQDRSLTETRIRVCAAAALARLQPDNRGAITYLQKVLVDDQWSVAPEAGGPLGGVRDPRILAANGLGLLGNDASSALPLLKRAMIKGREEKADLAVRAAWAIARIDPKDRSCLEVLKDAHFKNPMFGAARFHRETPETVARIIGDRMEDLAPAIVVAAFLPDANTRRYYIEILERAGDSAVITLVERAFQVIEEPEKWEKWDLYREGSYRALDSLGKGAEPAVDHLIDMLKSSHHLARAEAARVLGVVRRKPDKSIPALRRLLKDDRVIVRARAARSLGQFGHEANQTVDELQRLSSDDEYAWVRDTATQALTAINRDSRRKDK